MDDNLRREIMLENYQDPFHKGLVDDSGYERVNTNSESCIDNLDFIMKIEDNIIKDIRFDGEACAISTSASSILIRKLIGLSVEESMEILTNYEQMINEGKYDEDLLGELNAYCEIYKQPNRKNCALLPDVAIRKLFDKLNNSKKE